MKILKISVCVLVGVLVLCIAGTVALLYSPTIQTRIANAAFSGLEVSRLDAGLSRIEIENLTYADICHIKKVSAEYSAWDLILQRVKIDSLAAEGVKIRLPDREKNRNDTYSARISADTLPKKSTALTTPEIKAKFKCGWTFDIKSLAADVSVDEKKFGLIGKNISVGENFLPTRGRLEIAAENASLKAVLGTQSGLRDLKVLLSADNRRVLQISATSDAGYENFDVEARIDATDVLAKNFAPASLKLPKFSAAVYLRAKSSDAGKNASLKFTGDAKVSELAKVSPKLKFLGNCSISAELDAMKSGEEISVEKCRAALSERDCSILEISAKPFSAKADSDFENAELTAVAAIPSRLLNAAVEGFDISADDICAKLSLKRAGGIYKIKTTSPFSFTNFSAKRYGAQIVERLNVFMGIDAAISPRGTCNISAMFESADSKTQKFSLAIDATSEKDAVSFAARANGSLDPILSRIYSASTFASLGLKISAQASAKITSEKIALENFDAKISDAKDVPVADFSAAKNSTYNFAHKTVSSPSKELISVSAKKFPVAILRPFVPEIDAAAASFEAKIAMPKTGILECDADVSVLSLNYKKDGKLLLRDLSVSFPAEIGYENGTIVFRTKKGLVGGGKNNFAAFSADFEYDAEKKDFKSANIDISTAIAPIFDQPLLLKYANISRGSAEIKANYKRGKVEAQILAHGIATRTAQGFVDKLSANISTDFSDTKAALRANTTNGDSEISALLKMSPNEMSLFANAKTIVVEDAILLAGAFSNPLYDEKAQPESGKSQKIIRPNLAAVEKTKTDRADSIAKKDKTAFWYKGRNVKLSAKAESIVKSGTAILQNLELSADASESRVSISEFNGAAFGAKFGGSAEISFSTAREIPYDMKNASVKIDNFDISKIFETRENPPMTGTFDIDVSVCGKGNNAGHLFEFLTGKASAEAVSAGTLMILDRNSAAGVGASFAGAALKITGAILQNRVKELSGLGDLVSLLSRLNYTSARIELSRNNVDFDFNIDRAEIRTDSLIFNSTGGKILYDSAAPFKDWKLDIPVGIFVAKSVKTTFESAGYGRRAVPEFSGFFDGPRFLVSGTVSNPSNNLMDVLTNVGNSLGNVLEKINFFKRNEKND